MNPKIARKRYVVAQLGVAGGYLASLVGVMAILNTNTNLGLWQQIALGLIPALFVIAMLWVMWTLFQRLDEVARHYNDQAMTVGIFAVLAVSGTYGLLDMLVVGLPPLHIFWAFPMFFLAYAVSKFTLRDVAC